MKRVVALTLAAVCGAPLMTACTSNAPGSISTSAARALAAKVQHVREVASIGSLSQLRTAVRELKDLVASERRNSQVTADRAASIDDAADQLLVDATAAQPRHTATPTQTPTTQSPTPSPTPSQSASPTPTDTTSQSPTPGITVSVTG